MPIQHIVVIGAGLAGGRAVLELRRQGFGGHITLVGDEPHLPYERPPLSKSYLAGEPYQSHDLLPGEAWYAEQEITLRLGCKAVALERGRQQVILDDGTQLAYDRLLLATGSRPRQLPIPGARSPAVHYLRTLEDSERLGARLQPGTRLAIVGAGWIGLEVAAVAASKGCTVTVVDPHQVALQSTLGATIGGFFVDVHRAHGVEFVFGRRVTAISDTAAASTVVLDDGRQLAADVVVAGVGALPATELVDAGLRAADGGVRVDAHMQSKDPQLFAAGDIATIENPLYGMPLRSAHWTNALRGGRIAARAMLGLDARINPLPFIFTDQYDLFVEYAGWLAPDSTADVIVRGELQEQAFQAFWLDDGRVVAAMHVNRRDAGMRPLQALVRSGKPVEPALLADPTVPLGDLLA